MISYTNGNIFDSDAEALVNPVNTVGVMGKGLALEFKRRYPANARNYRHACLCQQVRIGNIYRYKEGGRYIFNFPTKEHWRCPSEYSYIEQGLDTLKVYIQSLAIRSIAIPALGCGLGELEWPRVKAILEEKLADLSDVDITIYEPHTKR